MDKAAVAPLRCSRCEYELTGLREGECPECGQPVAASIEAARHWSRERLERLRASLWCTLVAALWPIGWAMLMAIVAVFRIDAYGFFEAMVGAFFVITCLSVGAAVLLGAFATANRESPARSIAIGGVTFFAVTGILALLLAADSRVIDRWLEPWIVLGYGTAWYALLAWCACNVVIALGAHRPSRHIARASLLLLIPLCGLAWLTAILHLVAAEHWNVLLVPEVIIVGHMMTAVILAGIGSIALAGIVARLMPFIPRSIAIDPEPPPKLSSTER